MLPRRPTSNFSRQLSTASYPTAAPKFPLLTSTTSTLALPWNILISSESVYLTYLNNSSTCLTSPTTSMTAVSTSTSAAASTAFPNLTSSPTGFSKNAFDKAGYYQCATTSGLWQHKWRPILFCITVDKFSIEYLGKLHSEHLRDDLLEHYDITLD